MLDFVALDTNASREIGPSLKLGWRGKCPCCGQGNLYRGYLTVRSECAVCGEELHHQRADDGPAYLTILICGHLLAPIIHWVFVAFRPDPLLLGVSFSIIFVAMALYLLPRLKGGLIAYQWAKRMHGFAGPRSGSSL
ncbi:MAG: DUF983 domain-containing protein [Pseudomonadota bacterium]